MGGRIVHIVKRHSTIRHDGTQAITRAFLVLRAFSDVRREWTLADLTRHLGLTKPTTLRLLGALEREGMIQRSRPSLGYRLGARAIELGALAQRSTDLLAAARPELTALAHQTGETASLEVLAGTEILVLDEVRGTNHGSKAEFVGARWPAHAAATGKVLLAAARRDQSEAWREFTAAGRGRLTRYTPRTVVTMAAFGQELTAALRRGYAVAVEELEQGYVAIGAPVENHGGRTVAALCVGGQRARFSRERREPIVAAVVAAAQRISRQLGAWASAPALVSA